MHLSIWILRYRNFGPLFGILHEFLSLRLRSFKDFGPIK